MDLRQLRYFSEVARARSFRKAARVLNLSQSSLSRRVAELEASLATRLLSRESRGVSLTIEGQKFHARVDALLRDFEALSVSGNLRPQARETIVTLGMPSSVSRLALAQLVSRIKREMNSVLLKFAEGAQYDLLEGLDSGRIDLAIMNSPEPMANYSAETLWTEPLYLVTPHQVKRTRQRVALSDILSDPFVMFPRPSGHRNYLDRAARDAGGRFDVRYEISSTATQKNFARFSLANCLLPASAVRAEMDGLSAVSVDGLALRRVLVARTDRRMREEVVAIAELMRLEGCLLSEILQKEKIRPPLAVSRKAESRNVKRYKSI